MPKAKKARYVLIYCEGKTAKSCIVKRKVISVPEKGWESKKDALVYAHDFIGDLLGKGRFARIFSLEREGMIPGPE